MDFSAEVLTLFILVAVAVWKARETLKDLEERASQQVRRSSLGHGEPNDRSNARAVVSGRPVPEDGRPKTAIARCLDDVWLADRSFYPDRFLDSVRLVYETVVLAFAKGDRDVLRELVSAEVYDTFAQAIASREERREQVELSFVGFNRVEIVDAAVFNGHMQVTVDIESELVTAARDDMGRIVAGDPMTITVASDRWTFAKERTFRSPVWKLAATEMPPASERAESQMEQA
jgi:predicted lipid-binding transport protein (Tim44 family)